jgi:Secretion system C-terminal sorting domain/Beta-propeller repeat
MGILQWVARYNGPANGRDFAESLAIDAAGNVYVTGESTGVKSNYDYATVKYNARGTQLWVARYNGPGNDLDLAHSLAVDASGNVYVTGYSDAMAGATTFNNDYATIKYNKLGFRQWVRRYDGPSGAQDMANALVLDASGNVYVTGSSQNDPYALDYTTIKYDAAGTLEWLTIYSGPGSNSDYAIAMAVDASANVYVTGSSIGSTDDYATIKYSQPPDIAKKPAPAKLSKDLPSRFRVSNYPNPVTSTTRIQYELPYDGQVSVKVYDVLGREVATLVNAGMKAGYHSTDFNASSIQNGVYYYKIIVNKEKKVFKESREILIVK